MSVVVKQFFSSTKSLLHNLAQVRLESVPAGESWSVEKTGSKRHGN